MRSIYSKGNSVSVIASCFKESNVSDIAYLQLCSLSWMAPTIAGEGTSPRQCVMTIDIDMAKGLRLVGTDQRTMAF